MILSLLRFARLLLRRSFKRFQNFATASWQRVRMEKPKRPAITGIMSYKLLYSNEYSASVGQFGNLREGKVNWIIKFSHRCTMLSIHSRRNGTDWLAQW